MANHGYAALGVVADEGLGPVAQVVGLVLVSLAVGPQLTVLVDLIVRPVRVAAESVPLVPTRRHVSLVLVAVQ
jgi:hypothetical protein